MCTRVVALIDLRRGRRVPPLYGRRREEVLRKKLGVLVATAMMLFMVASPALAAAGGNPSAGSCGIGEGLSSALREGDFKYNKEKIEPSPGDGEASDLPPTNCSGND